MSDVKQVREALNKAITEALPLAGGDVRRSLEHLQGSLDQLDTRKLLDALKWGELARMKCTATGRYLGKFGDQHLGLFVSAMDNSVNIDQVDPDGDKPSENLPVPTDRELEAAANGIRWAVQFTPRADG